MQNIILRVWDRVNKKFIFEGSLKDNFASILEQMYLSWDNYIIDLWIGRLDITGSRIFNNDIVRYVFSNPINDLPDEAITRIISYNPDWYSFTARRVCSTEFDLTPGWDMQVIGNAHEGID